MKSRCCLRKSRALWGRERRLSASAAQEISVFAVQKIRSILSNGIEQIADIAVEQQHTNGDGWHAVRHLAIRSNADRPSGFTERYLWPAELDVHDATAVGVDWADRFNLLPRDVLRHQSMIENAALVN
jgi:hypothetical protein